MTLHLHSFVHDGFQALNGTEISHSHYNQPLNAKCPMTNPLALGESMSKHQSPVYAPSRILCGIL